MNQITAKLKKAVLASTRNKEVASVREDIITFFRNNEAPGDGDVHELAERHGLTPEAFEAEIYHLLSDLIRGSAQ
jgi:hypothetical protein